jgi:hypothetical protein
MEDQKNGIALPTFEGIIRLVIRAEAAAFY